MIEYRYFVLEKKPNDKYYNIVQVVKFLGIPFQDACYQDRHQAEAVLELVSNARPDYKFKIKKVKIA